MPTPVAASVVPTSPTTSAFSLRSYLPGETPQTVFAMTPTMTPVATQPTAFMQTGESSTSESGGSGASGTSIPGGQTLAGVHGTQLLAEQLLQRQQQHQQQQQQQQQQQRLYEAALGLESEGIKDSIQGGSKRDNESGNPLQGDHVQVARELMAASGRYRHLATTQLEFLTAAEEWRC